MGKPWTAGILTTEALQKVKSRAAFELECPPDKLEAVPLSTSDYGGFGRVTQMGITGCNRKAVYVRLMPYVSPYPGDEWVINAQGGKAQ